MSILVEEQEEEEKEAVVVQGVPVCGANFSSPVVDTVYYIDQIHYKIGNRLLRMLTKTIKITIAE